MVRCVMFHVELTALRPPALAHLRPHPLLAVGRATALDDAPNIFCERQAREPRFGLQFCFELGIDRDNEEMLTRHECES
jgi:hypothetical protein